MLGSSYLALLLQTQGSVGASSGGAENTSFLNLLASATPVSVVVLAILVLLSVACWTIILYKLVVFRRSRRHSVSFLDVFRRSNKFSEVQAVCRSLGESPLVGLFQAGYTELNAQLRGAGENKPGIAPSRPTLRSLDAVDRALLRASTMEVSKLEHRVSFLATTASISPYIGLFGTVWGIMTSFLGIASQGSTSLNVVAPGIAEALIATAIGLFAAIPAVYFYNDITNSVKKFANEMDDFSMEFLTIAERNFT